MPCKSDVKLAILDTAFDELTDRRHTFTRINDDTIKINNAATNPKTKSHSRVQDRAIARDLASRVKRSFNGHILAEINELSPYDPVTITFHPSQAYIDHEYNRLNEPKDTGIDFEPIEYELRGLAALNSPRSEEIFSKGERNNWGLDKILTELQVPKDQKQLILQSGAKTREDAITSLAAYNSYVVEINTAKGVEYLPRYEYNEFGEAFQIGEELEERNTEYYSNLTVPGGTNYTENEIATPAITPSIKGHAQFSTSNGIGWFRSDEKVVEGTYEEKVSPTDGINLSRRDILHIGEPTKTRRIIEVQSDLFQKGRDKELLIPTEGNSKATLEDFQSKESLEKFENNLTKSSENQFLQLLNKGNNWVSFFIKSIIQDSAKKGYENVLFPTGDTASKVEGHTTLEEFKKRKEDRIKELEGAKQKRFDEIPYINDELIRVTQKLIDKNIGNIEKNIERLNEYKKQKEAGVDVSDIDNEINQLKQELERVEKEGFAALKPIYKFYEETLTNTLDDIAGGNKNDRKNGKWAIEKITDEHGNTWSKYTIKDKSKDRVDFEPDVEGEDGKVILPIGTSGSGKSTWIDSLPKNKYTVISPDEMRVEFTGDINDKSKDKEIYEEVKKRTIEAIHRGKQVIIDSTNLQKERRRDFISAVKSAVPKTSIEYKLMELNPELAKQRIKDQIARGEDRANVSDSTIDRHTALYKEMLEDIKKERITPFEKTVDFEPDIEPKTEDNLPREQVRNMVNANTGMNTDSQFRSFEPRDDGDVIAGVYRKSIENKKAQMANYVRRLNEIKDLKKDTKITVTRLSELKKEEKEIKETLYGNGLTGKYEIKGLKQEIDEITSDTQAFMRSVGYYVERDLERLDKLVNSTNPADLEEADRLINFYDLAGSFDGKLDNPFFERSDIFLKDEDGKETTTLALPKEVMDQYKQWRDKAIGQRRLVDAGKEQITVDTVNELPSVQATYGKEHKFDFDTLMYKNTGLKDTDFISMWTMDATHGLGGGNGLLPQATLAVLQRSIENKEAWSRYHDKSVEAMLPDVEKELNKLGYTAKSLGITGAGGVVYNLFKQISKEGNESHSLVQRYTKEQQDSQSLALDKFQRQFARGTETDEPMEKKTRINRAFDNLKKYKRENLIIFDIKRMEDADYRKEMEAILGKKGYEEQLENQKYQLTRYEVERQDKIDTILAVEGKSNYEDLEDSSKNAIKLWELRHNPERGIEDYYSVSGLFFGDIRDNNFMDYNTFIPRKYEPVIKANIDEDKYEITDSEVKTENYDKSFAQIESNPILSKFYDKVKEFCEVVHKHMPYDLQQSMSTYTLPSLMKTSSEIINDKNTGLLEALFAPFRKLMEKIRLSFGVVRQGNISFAVKDPITGKPNTKVNDNFLRRNSTAIYNRIKIEETKFMQAYNTDITDEKKKLNKLGRFKTLDLNKLNPQSLLLLSDYLHAGLSLHDAQSGNIQAIRNKLRGDNEVEVGRLIADFSVHSVVQALTFDLPKIMSYYGSLTMAYAARQEALPVVNIMRNHYNAILQPETNNVGEAIRNRSDGEFAKIGIRTRAMRQFDEQFERVYLGNKGYKHSGVFGAENKDGNIPLIGKTIYSKEERAQYDELQKLIENEPDAKKKEELKKIQDNLGRTRTLTAILDNFLDWIRTLKLGYNVSSMITNFAEGMISDITLGSSDEFFDSKEMAWALGAMKHSFVKNATFGYFETPIAKKTRGFVDKFNVVIDNKNELQKASHGFSSKLSSIFKRFEGNSRVEYINQTPLMIAILRTMKLTDANGKESSVWDAFDDNINLKPEFRTEENIANWEQNGAERQVFTQKLNAVITLGHGNYSDLRGMLLKSTSGGKVAAMFKSWIPEAFFWRFAKEQDNIALGKVGFRGRYWSYGGGGGLVHGATVGAVLFGPMGALIGGGLGLAAGLRTGTNTGGGMTGLIKETILTTKQLILRALGMPINFVSSVVAGKQIIGDNIGKNAFESWIGKGTFTKQDEYNMKANMTDLALQVALLAMIIAVKGMLWNDNDKPDDPEREAHNILVNKLMQTSSQLAMYVNPVDIYHSTIGSMGALTYLVDLGKEIDKVQSWANGDDILTSGVNAGKSGLGIQTKKILLPGMFKDPMLGFKSMSQTIYPQDSPWGRYFHGAEYNEKKELRQNRSELRTELEDDPEIKAIEDEKERKKAVDREVLRQFPSNKKLESLGETRKEYESQLTPQ